MQEDKHRIWYESLRPFSDLDLLVVEVNWAEVKWRDSSKEKAEYRI